MSVNRNESWPVRLRALSFAITIGVTLGEFALVAAPLGIVVWALGAAPASTIAASAGALAAIFSLSIAVYGHVRPIRIPRRVLNGGMR